MKTLIKVEDYALTLTTNDDAHSLYSERHDFWVEVREAVRLAMHKHIKEWKLDNNHHNQPRN